MKLPQHTSLSRALDDKEFRSKSSFTSEKIFGVLDQAIGGKAAATPITAADLESVQLDGFVRSVAPGGHTTVGELRAAAAAIADAFEQADSAVRVPGESTVRRFFDAGGKSGRADGRMSVTELRLAEALRPDLSPKATQLIQGSTDHLLRQGSLRSLVQVALTDYRSTAWLEKNEPERPMLQTAAAARVDVERAIERLADPAERAHWIGQLAQLDENVRNNNPAQQFVTGWDTLRGAADPVLLVRDPFA